VTYTRDTTPPVITATGTTLTLGCNPTSAQIDAALGTATATDNCGPVTPTATTGSVASDGCSRSQPRTWNVSDACGNAAAPVLRTVTWIVDLTKPTITCPPDLLVCAVIPAPDTTTVVAASDNCIHVTVSHVGDVQTVSGCAIVVKRTYRATDDCGNYAECTQTITCVPKSLVTNTERCCFDCNPGSGGQQFRLLFTPDVTQNGCYKLNASNPGQFYYNVFLTGTPGTPVSITVSVPYPFVTQGAVPVHVYDGVTVYGASGPLDGTCPASTCLTPGTDVSGTFSYSPGALTASCGPVPGAAQTITVTGIIPPSGFVFVAIHVDYGLKGCTGYNQDGSANAVTCGTSTIVVPNNQNYAFTASGSQGDSPSVQSFNVFKKNPGVGGGANKNSLADGVTVKTPVRNCAAVLKDAKGAVLASGVTDEDGWYMLPYKYTGKATTLYVTLTPPGKPAQTQTITLKANGYVQVDFTVPSP
jgi:hypothetical protein